MIETVVNEKLINAIIDDAEAADGNAAGSTMGGRSGPRMQAAASVTRRRIHRRGLTGMLLNAQLAGSSLSYLQGNASIRASLTTL